MRDTPVADLITVCASDTFMPITIGIGEPVRLPHRRLVSTYVTPAAATTEATSAATGRRVSTVNLLNASDDSGPRRLLLACHRPDPTGSRLRRRLVRCALSCGHREQT